MGDMGDGWGWWMLFGTVMMFGSVAAIVWAVTARDRRPLERGEQQSPASSRAHGTSWSAATPTAS